MSKASSVVASVTQQSMQTVPQSRTKYRERPKATWVQSDGTTARRADDQRRSADDVSVPSRRSERNRQLDTVARYWWGSDESRWWLYTWRVQARQASGLPIFLLPLGWTRFVNVYR